MRKIKPEVALFMKFCESQGIKFVDHETGEEVKLDDCCIDYGNQEDKTDSA